MNRAEKNSKKINRLRWLCFVPASVMYIAAEAAFGTLMGITLGAVFGIAFFMVCHRGSMMIVCEDIVEDMKTTLDKIGQAETIFEVKCLSTGFVVRVYLIKAKNRAQICRRAIIEKLEQGWYKNKIWVTQVIAVENEEDIKKAQKALNVVLLGMMQARRKGGDKEDENKGSENKDDKG